MFVIEIDVDREISGPLHGELTALISDALAARAPGYAQRIRVSWSDKQCGICSAVGHTSDEHPRARSAEPDVEWDEGRCICTHVPSSHQFGGQACHLCNCRRVTYSPGSAA